MPDTNFTDASHRYGRADLPWVVDSGTSFGPNSRAADNYSDFYDGTWQNSSSHRIESGISRSFFNRSVWTGTNTDGTTHATYFMGATGSNQVRRWTFQSGTITAANQISSNSDFIVALSPVFQVAGTATNAAPTVANPIDDQTATVGTALNFTFPTDTFADTDAGATLTYTATQSDDSTLPSWLTFAAATRTFSGTPTAAGTVSVKVTASDGTDSVSDTFDIVVSAAADTTPPEVASVEVSTSTTGDNLAITFDENLDQTAVSIGLASAFSVTADGQNIAISLFSGFDEIVNLRASLSAPAIRQGQTVVVSYADPTAGDDTVALQDIAGNDVASFTTGMAGVPAVTNNSTSIAPTGAPTITGTAQVGQTLTAVTTGITDANGLTSVTYTYQWIRANGTEADIASANSSTYDLVAADLGKTIKVKVSFTDDASHAETLTSAATATVVAAPTAPAPTVTDVDVTSMPASGDTYGTGERIQYTVTFDQSVTVTGAPEFEFCLGTGSCTVTPFPSRRRAPLLSGSGTMMLVFSYTVIVGDVDDNGIWAGNQDRTIKLEGGTIQGTVGGLDAVLTHDEVGRKDDHKVNGAAANNAPTVANPIDDQTATVGTALNFTFPANTFADTDAGATLTYTAAQSDDTALPSWLSFDAATRTFSGTPTAAETVSVKVTASDGTDSVSDTFDIVVSAAANNAAMGAPTITGTAQVGQTLTAVTTGITDADGLTNVTYTYQWIRANGTEADIASANSSTYDLVAADLGKTIKVKVSFTDDTSNTETLTSAATATVTAAPTAPMVTDVDVTSMPASGDTYGTGERIQYTVTFDQAVTVTGTPEFEFCLGSSATVSCTVGSPPPALRSAALLSGSGTTALVFSYTVMVGDVDDNGIYAGDQSETLKLDSGDAIQGTVGGLDAVLTHNAVGSPTGHKVNGVARGVTVSKSALTVTEQNTTGNTYTVVLDTRPTADVMVTVFVPGGTDVTLTSLAFTSSTPSSGTLTFTRAIGTRNWNVAQTVTVKAGNDTDLTNDTVTLTHSAASTDGNYNGITIGSVVVTVEDNDTAQVTGVAVTSGNAGLLVNWVAVDNATGYKVQWKSGTESYDTTRQATITSGSTISHTIASLTNGTEYTVRVTATRTGANDGPPSAEVMGTPGAPGVTVSESALTVTEEDTTGGTYTVVLNTQPTANVTVTVAGHAGTDVTLTPSSGTLTFTTTNWNTAQTVTVKADTDTDTTNDTVTLTHSATSTDTNYGGITIGSVVVTVEDNDTAQVTGVMVASGNARLVVNWVAVDNATGYKVQWKSGSQGYNTGTRQATITSGTTMNHTITGLTNGTEYTVRVTATRTGANDGLPSAEVMETPAVPTTAGVTVSTMALMVTEQNTTGDTYTVVLDTQPTASVTVTVAGHSGTDVTLTPSSGTLTFTTTNWSTAQTVTVKAANDTDLTNDTVTLTHSATSTDTNYGGITIANVVVTVADNDTARVTGVTVAAGNARLVVNWVAVGNATGYKVQWKSGTQSYNTGNRQATITSGTTMNHTITGLTNGTEYTVRVTATRTGANDGLPSAEVMEMPTLLVAPGVTVSESALTVTEENATGDTYTVVLNTQPTANVTVTVSGHTGTDVTPAPASLTFTSVTWSTVRTVRVTAGNDADMANDTVTLAHSATSTDPGYNGIMIAGVVVTVTDNDVVRPPPPPPPTNTPPVVANPLADQEATTGASFTYVIPAAAFTDADGTTLAYTATLSDGGRLPSWLTFDPATRTFTGTPGPGDGGTVRVTVMASDGTVTVSDEFVLMVTVRNTAPVVANPLADQEVMIDVPFTYVVPADAFTDADGDPLTYTAATRDGGLLPGWLTFDPITRTFTGTPASSDSGPVFVTVTASDGTATVSDEFAVRVLMVAPSTLRAWTSRFGRTVATHVTDAVGERLRALPEQDSQVTVGGYRLPLGRQAAGGGDPETTTDSETTDPETTDPETATAPKTATDRLASLLTGLVGRALGLGAGPAAGRRPGHGPVGSAARGGPASGAIPNPATPHGPLARRLAGQFLPAEPGG